MALFVFWNDNTKVPKKFFVRHELQCETYAKLGASEIAHGFATA
jgi:hypothetical protein